MENRVAGAGWAQPGRKLPGHCGCNRVIAGLTRNLATPPVIASERSERGNPLPQLPPGHCGYNRVIAGLTRNLATRSVIASRQSRRGNPQSQLSVGCK